MRVPLEDVKSRYLRGYAALAGVTLQQGLYRCAVAIAPVSDINELHRTDYKESGSSKMLRSC